MWSVPRMWDGETCVVLASGPSMSQAVADQVKTAGTRAIAINTTFRLAPWADMLYAADARWWRFWWENKEAQACDFQGLKVSCEAHDGVLQLRHTGPSGFDPNPGCVRTGSNSGYQAIHIAAHAGCSRILLCGFDMKGGHWHGKHPEPLRNLNESIYSRWLGYFDDLAGALSKKGIKVLNCTPGSALKTFPMADLKEALARVEPVETASRLSA